MRLINADDLIEEIKNSPLIDFTDDDIIKLIGIVPTVKPERPRGEWKEFIMPLPLSDYHYKLGVICTNCNTTWDCSTNYCPYCGADMRGNNNV